MGRRSDRWAPPARGGKPPTEPIEPIDLYPNPLPPPRPPETRETILADLHAAFASLSEEELKVAQLWVYGRTPSEIGHFLKMSRAEVRRAWKRMRRKLREALISGAGRKGAAPSPSRAPEPSPGTPPGTGGISERDAAT
jgi:DNA-directed RNA polymerase specialized sigma24 family protein